MIGRTYLMTCASCGRTVAWPDGFAGSLTAQCWPCAWGEHQQAEHPAEDRRVGSSDGRDGLRLD